MLHDLLIHRLRRDQYLVQWFQTIGKIAPGTRLDHVRHGRPKVPGKGARIETRQVGVVKPDKGHSPCAHGCYGPLP